MGAEVQSNMYFPGYYTLRNVKENAGTGGTNHGNHFERFLARSSVFADSSCYAKEQMKQTILKHEYTFKHQLQELHQIYRKQKDLMNDIKCQSHELRISEKTSQSSLFSSHTAYEDTKVEWYNPSFCCLDPPSSSRPSTSNVGIINSPFIVMEKKQTLPAGSLSSCSRMRSGTRDSHDLTCKKLQRGLFNLELPAEKYDSDEEQTWKSYELDINNEPNMVEESNFGTRKRRLVDLNESVQVEEVLVAASINTLGNNGYSRGWLSSTSLTSSFHPLTTDSSDDTIKRDEVACVYSQHLQNRINTKDSCGSFSGVEQTGYGKFLGRSTDQIKFNLEKMADPLRGSQVDLCQSKAKTKKTIFGVDLTTRVHDLPFIGSDMSCLDLDQPSSSKLQSSTPDGVYHSERLQNEVLSSNNLVFVKELKENAKGNLHWNAGDKNICKRTESSSLQSSPQFLADTTVFENHLGCQSIEELYMRKSVQNIEQNAKVHQGLSIGKILGVPIYDKPYTLLKACRPSSDDENAAKVEPVSHPHCGRQHIFKDLILEKGLNSSSNIIRHQIDLNLCLVEEEFPLALVTPNASVKNAVEIDLEAPAVFDIKQDNAGKVETSQCIIKIPCEPPDEKPSESRDGLVEHAAKALVALSSISTYDPSNDFCSLLSDTLTGGSLHWFADMVFCHQHELENESTISKGSSSCEEYSPDEFDYFEFMTLKLTETKLEACSYTPNDSPTDMKDEDTLPKRPRRGQARRGRPRKDFIRDILPTISSLSRLQVTEDIQTFEAIVRASGGTWESSLAKRKSGKNRCGRGRKQILTPPVMRTNSLPSRQQTDHTQAILDEGRLVGWGKKTRRPPRQRGPVTDGSLLGK